MENTRKKVLTDLERIANNRAIAESDLTTILIKEEGPSR